MYNYKFTVFTPCYNGEKTIHRVFDSMKSQTYTNWEWIIINDGSADDSASVIKSLIYGLQLKGKKIKYLEQENAGKHIAWNRAIRMATGDFFVPADCDDSFMPGTLEFYNQKANELRGGDFCKSNLSGISVCTFDPETGKLRGTPYPEDGIISDDIELAYRYHVTGEKWGCVRVDLIKQRPFPELKGHFYNENYLWFSFPRDGYKKANYNKLIRAYYYEPNSLCNTKTSRYDSNKAVMQMSFEWWKITNVGNLIWMYSKSGYIDCYKYLLRAMIKWTLSKIKGK